MKKNKEQRFLELIGDYKIEIIGGQQLYYYIKNIQGHFLITHDQESEITWVSDENIYFYFKRKYQMKLGEFRLLMGKMLLKHFNIKDTTVYLD